MKEPDPIDSPPPGFETSNGDVRLMVPVWTAIPIAVAFAVALIWAFGSTRLLVSLLPFAAFGAAVTVVDMRELRIPNRLTRPATVIAVPLLWVASTAGWSDLSLTRAALGAVAMSSMYLMLALVWPDGLGLGDVKLAVVLGAQLGLFGWITIVRGVFAAHLLMGPVAIVVLLTHRAGRRAALPLGPFLVAGSIAALVIEART